ncbi:hypothetical protein L3V86_00095 [Thiotrichales bacterium 19S11-10]|nr:hypothetical protein [Thiotrichales bacterium 19S11-10]
MTKDKLKFLKTHLKEITRYADSVKITNDNQALELHFNFGLDRYYKCSTYNLASNLIKELNKQSLEKFDDLYIGSYRPSQAYPYEDSIIRLYSKDLVEAYRHKNGKTDNYNSSSSPDFHFNSHSNMIHSSNDSDEESSGCEF